MNKEELHELRKKIDANIQIVEEDIYQEWKVGYPEYEKEIIIAHIKLQEAKMWVGKCLEKLGSELPKEFKDKN